jgi:hypothetical protein
MEISIYEENHEYVVSMEWLEWQNNHYVVIENNSGTAGFNLQVDSSDQQLNAIVIEQTP